jgi:hypothetical protein
MRKSKILAVALIGILLAGGLVLVGCSTFDYSSPSCPSSSGCNGIFYCGQWICIGGWGGKCDC